MDRDTVKDFTPGEDRIALDRFEFATFAGHAAGALGAGELTYGSRATTADQHLIYNSATGALYYDPDGVGGLAQVQIATLAGHPLLTGNDIFLI